VPRYEYKCRECDLQKQVTHSMQIKLTDCESCGSKESLYRLISNFSTKGLDNTKTETEAKPGKIVNDFIKNAKQEVKEYKSDITKDVFGVEDVVE
jgi:putative FmdB family regulatory protein